MWLWACELHELGFRRRSQWYWQCERRYGLPADAYLSIFVDHDCTHFQPEQLACHHISTFHVTFLLSVDRVHFYYHECADNTWEPGGHTSSGEIRRHGEDPRALRDEADAIAMEVVAACGGILL